MGAEACPHGRRLSAVEGTPLVRAACGRSHGVDAGISRPGSSFFGLTPVLPRSTTKTESYLWLNFLCTHY